MQFFSCVSPDLIATPDERPPYWPRASPREMLLGRAVLGTLPVSLNLFSSFF